MLRKSLYLLLLIGLLIGCAAFADNVPTLEVHFLNVGRNDGILIVCEGEAAFIDSGSHFYGEKSLAYMQEYGIEHLKYYIGTHAHTDHVGGAGVIMANIPTDMILTNYSLAIEAMLARCDTSAEKKAVQNTPVTYVNKGDVFYIGSAELECIGPSSYVRYAKYTDGSENRNSIIFRLSYGAKTFILTGDATNDELREVLKDDPDALKCSVFKNPHHDNGIDDEIAEQIETEYFVYSTNTKYTPSNHQIYNAKRTGGRVLITSYNNAGTVAFSTDGTALWYTTEFVLEDTWKLEISKVTLKVGATKSYYKTMRPSRMIETLYYESSDSSVATVDPALGTITAVSKGVCTIMARAFDGTFRTINVTVK